MDTKGIMIPIESDETPKPQPKRYIRTLERDIQVFQAGGDPDFTLYPDKGAPRPSGQPEATTAPASPAVENTDIRVDEAIVPPAIPERPKDVPPIPVATPAPIASTVKAEAPRPQPIPETPPKPVVPPEPRPSPLETYSGDFRKRMEDMNASTTTVLAAEQDAAAPSRPTPESRSRMRWYVIAGVILFLIGDLGVYVAYRWYTAAQMPVAVSLAPSTPIFVDSQAMLPGSGNALYAFERLIADPLPANTIALISLGGAATTSGQKTVLESLVDTVPGALSRSTRVPNSIAGIVNVAGSQSPFFMLSVDSYSVSFSSMLAWEPTLPNDLAAIFPPHASSTASATDTIAATKFRDEVIANHDVRIYRDAGGRSVMLYGYWDKNMLIIARDPISFGELLDRLAASVSR